MTKDDPIPFDALSTRAVNVLRNAELSTVGEVRAYCARDLMVLPHCGILTAAEIASVIGPLRRSDI